MAIARALANAPQVLLADEPTGNLDTEMSREIMSVFTRLHRDQGVTIVQGLQGGQPAANLYFDDSGLLVRLVTWTRTPIAFVPTQIDYADYRDVMGVKVPFKRTVSQTYMRMSIELSDVQPNATIDRKVFERPAPVAPAA